MSAWALKEHPIKGATWDSVFDRACGGEPQFVTRDDAHTVVIISLSAYNTGHARKRRVISNNPKLACSIKNEDLFSDDSQLWEACNDQTVDA